MQMVWVILEFMGFFSVMLWRVHLMSILIGLEMISLGLAWGIVWFESVSMFNFFFIYFIIISVCEAVLGVMLMVYFIRASGWDDCKFLVTIF